MNTLFKYFLDNYLDDEQFDNKDKGYHQVLVNQLPNYIETLVDDKYKIKGSCGASNKAEIPWIGIFNKNITTSAQYGIYVVYLFCADMSGFYLCLGQGITNFEKFGCDKENIMYKVADYFKGIISSDFSKADIHLLSKTTNGKNYEKVNILNKYYSKEHIDSYNFESDLKEMIKIYEDIAEEMKYHSYDDIIDNLISNTNPNYIMEKEAIKMIENELLAASDVEQGETITLKEVAIPIGKKKTKYSQISRKTIKKIDYAKKQKKNADNGLLGEKLVMAYEEEKLRLAGREDLIEKIKWISKEDDGTGYDILSYDENGNEIYIEVKATEGNDNSIFYISVNEINTMNKYKFNYYIYRVFNLKTDNPEVFILDYESFKNNISLSVNNYVAELKDI